MKFYVIAILALAALAVIGGGGYALHKSWYGEGYNARVGEESKAFNDAEAKAQKDQQAADASSIKQLQQALANANQAVSDRDDDLADAADTISVLKGKLSHDKNPDDRRWLDLSLPCSLQLPPSCPGHATGNPGH